MNMSPTAMPSTSPNSAPRIVNNLAVIQTPTDVRRSDLIKQSRRIPKTTFPRLQASWNDIDTTRLPQSNPETYFYLGYGSNLSAEAFLVKRGIKPLSQVNVVVPEISLTFDLAGIPYREPCFGNCRFRTEKEKSISEYEPVDYHKNRWHKGLVGVVYEVTAEDFAHIIATEGGSSTYQDVLVDCYPLADDPDAEVPLRPEGASFKAHTLFAETARARPDPAYAQPSARYMKLIKDGAEEHNLPHEYRSFLEGIRTYRITTKKQQIGQTLFLAIWGPIVAFLIMGAGKLLAGKDGKFPKWFRVLTAAMFTALWLSYDQLFKPTFGDGERTMADDNEEKKRNRCLFDLEKSPLLKTRDTTRIKEKEETRL